MAKKKTTRKAAAGKKPASKTTKKKKPARKKTARTTTAAKKSAAKAAKKKKPTKKKTPAKKKTAKTKVAKKKSARKTAARKTSARKKATQKAAASKKPAAKKVKRKKPASTKATRKPATRTEPDAQPSAPDVVAQEPVHHRGFAAAPVASAPVVTEAAAALPEVSDPGIPQSKAPPPEPGPEVTEETTGRPSGSTPIAAASDRRASTDNKPVIFLAFANDRDDTIGYLRNLPDEARRLREVLQPAEQAGLCEVVVRTNSTAGDILSVFQDPRYRDRVAIFHYGGHANGYQLLLETASGQSAAADAGGLAAFLGQQRGLKLVFLNGCSTQEQTQGLLDADIAAVVSTSRSIDDQVATNFSCCFYQSMAGGTGIRVAFNEAEAAAKVERGGSTRAFYLGGDEERTDQMYRDRWPWELYTRPGAERTCEWNLPEAVDNPLFGLPPLPERDLPQCPFRHLDWFTNEHAEVFFGRSRQIRELYDRLAASRTAPIVLFYGQSGVGKSSILSAGLFPRLEQDYEVRYLRRGDGGLLDTLRFAFLPDAYEMPDDRAWQVEEKELGKPLIVILDQVEEVFTRPLPEMPEELNQLLRAVKRMFGNPDSRPRGKLVLSFRKEWLAELEERLAEHELPRAKVFLEPLDQRGIIEAVRGPSQSLRLQEHYGLTVEDGLAEMIADDLVIDDDSAIAPTLQILLTKMWTRATAEDYEHPKFTRQLYSQLQRDGILLRDFLNQQIAAFREFYPEAVDSGLLLDIVALHTTPLGTADYRSLDDLQRDYAHLGVTLPDLLQKCQDLHLLTVASGSQREKARSTRLAHDTLAPLVRERFDLSDKPGQRARRILDNRTVDWQGDQEGAPLDIKDLELVERGQSGTRSLTDVETRLLAASRRERAKRLRVQRTLKIVGSVAVLVIMVLAFYANWEREKALDKLAEQLVAKMFLSVDGDSQEYDRILGDITEHRTRAIPHLEAIGEESADRPSNADDMTWNGKQRIAYGKQRADAAIALFRLEEFENAVKLLRLEKRDDEVGVDPEPLTQFIHRCKDRGVEAEDLYAQLLKLMNPDEVGDKGDRKSEDEMPCYTLLLALGEWKKEELPSSITVDLNKLGADLSNTGEDADCNDGGFLTWYRCDPSSAIHSACGWLLRKWEFGETVKAADKALAEKSVQEGFNSDKEWFVLKLVPAGAAADSPEDCFTFVVFEHGDFPVAKHIDEAFDWGDYVEGTTSLTTGSVANSFAICDREITKLQFGGTFDRKTADQPKIWTRGEDDNAFKEASNYCKDLSDMSGIAFSLPTFDQWEYACRAGTVTPYSFGNDKGMLKDYSDAAVGFDRPNLRGLFGVHANQEEWCSDTEATPRTGRGGMSSLSYFSLSTDAVPELGLRICIEKISP